MNVNKKAAISRQDKEELSGNDLPDNQHDTDRMQPASFTIDLPEVKDIPGQEFIQPPKMNSFADTTISSADEEGEGIFEEEDNAETKD